MASTYYATASTALCAPSARVLEFDRLLHTPPTTPHLSHDYLPNRHVAANIPIPGSHSRPPHAAASITKTGFRPPITALNPLRPIAPAFVCWNLLTTASSAPTVSNGRHPKTPLSAVKYVSVYRPRRTWVMSASLDAPSAVICRFGLLP